MLVPINITGQTYKSRSRPLSFQTTQNFYSDLVDNQNAKSGYVLMPFPGMKLFGTTTGADRGMLEHQTNLYKVSGSKLYDVDSSGVHTELGSIPGTARCILEGINSNVVIVTQGKAYLWNGSTVAEITDVDLETPNSCTHLRNVMIYDGDGGRFCTSDVGDATSIDGLNYATAESNADDLKRVYTFGDRAFMLGDKTTEEWWFSGVGSPPLDQVQGGTRTIGIAAIHSVANNDNAMYFLGDDNRVYQNFTPIDTIAIHNQISSFSQVSDAIGFCFTLEGHNFYKLTFPGVNKSFLFSERTGWHTLSSGTQGGRSYANSYAYAFRKHLVADYRNGNIYEWDVNTFTDNGDMIIRQRDTGPLHGGLFNLPGKELTMNYFELIMETGVGLISGQGSDPKIMLSYSDDGGRTFGNEAQGSIGKLGQYQWQVRWDNLGSFYERVMRIRISDPVFCSIHNAAADIEAWI